MLLGGSSSQAGTDPCQQAVTEKGKAFRVRAFGLSMHPFIKNRDIITVSPLPSGWPRLGDVAATIHSSTGKLIVHRVVGFKEGSYIIKGDNVPRPDGQMPGACIQGYVTRVEPEPNNGSIRIGADSALRTGCKPLKLSFIPS